MDRRMAEKYYILARKYRPQLFSEVIGQDAIVTTLKNAILQKRLAQSYLFCGSKGTGKTTLARLFAKAINCQKITSDAEPCNECPSCQEISQGKSLDCLEIDGASNRGIDDIRQINETVGYAPSSGKYKIYIIDEVHMLTKEAFNALLKTLEEPPVNVKFFLATTEPQKVLPTIISRCQRFDLHRISTPLIVQKLQKIAEELQISVEEGALYLIAEKSEGSLRDAESLLDQVICYSEGPILRNTILTTLGVIPHSLYFQLDHAIIDTRIGFAFELTNTIYSSGKDLPSFIEGLIEHFRTHLVHHLGGAFYLPYLTEEERKHYQKISPCFTSEECLAILDDLIESLQQIQKTPFQKITLEMILLRLIRTKQRLSLGTLVKRLTELEKRIDSNVIVTEAPLEKLPEKKPLHTARTDTLLRFAAVELEGTLKKEIK